MSEVLQSITNGVISVMVNVNELCAGGNEYIVFVNIVDDANIIITKENSTFEDGTFVFNQLSPGTYSCVIIVTNISGVILSREIVDCDIPFPTTTCKFHCSQKNKLRCVQ